MQHDQARHVQADKSRHGSVHSTQTHERREQYAYPWFKWADHTPWAGEAFEYSWRMDICSDRESSKKMVA